MFCIVFEPKLWYYHQFFIVWKSNLWCFCIFCVVLEAKLRNYHMFWHFSSILHRVDHHFIMNMLFFLQFLHIFDPNLPTTPSVNWKFAVVSWLLGNHLHLKYGTSHAEKKKTWLSSQCCTNQRQKAWLYPQESEHKKCARRAKSNAPGRGCTRSKPWNKGLHQTKTCKQHVFIPRDQIALFLAVALYWAGPKYACPVVNFGVTSRRISETLLRRARRRTHLVPAAAAGWQSWRLRQTGRRKSGSKTLKGCHCWDPTIVFWWFGAWAASNTRTLQGGCTPYFPNETVEQRSFSTWHRFRELCFCHRVQETGMQAKYVKAKCFGSSQGDQESDVSNYWQLPVQPHK